VAVLSRREQQLLIEIERSLTVHDPELAARLSPSPTRPDRTRAVVIGVGLLLGVVAPAVIVLAAPGVAMRLLGLGLALLGWTIGMLARLDR
jgi:protein-S-isoprenylcysteine O-methyltransferase Ste14